MQIKNVAFDYKNERVISCFGLLKGFPRMIGKQMILCAGLSIGMVVSCGPAKTEPSDQPDIIPAEQVIGTALPLGFAGAAAMAAASGNQIAGVDVDSAFTTFPCTRQVTIHVGDSCPLPLGDSAAGVVVIVGIWQSPTQASLSCTFTNVSVGGRKLVVAGVSTCVVQSSGNHVTITYVDQNVNVSSGEQVNASQSAWSIDVDTRGTLTDVTDDMATISGARQVVQGASVQQVTLSGVVMDAQCRKNPIDGSATVSNTGIGSISTTIVSFHSACDGKADVQMSVGTGQSGSGSTIAIDLLN